MSITLIVIKNIYETEGREIYKDAYRFFALAGDRIAGRDDIFLEYMQHQNINQIYHLIDQMHLTKSETERQKFLTEAEHLFVKDGKYTLKQAKDFLKNFCDAFGWKKIVFQYDNSIINKKNHPQSPIQPQIAVKKNPMNKMDSDPITVKKENTGEKKDKLPDTGVKQTGTKKKRKKKFLLGIVAGLAVAYILFLNYPFAQLKSNQRDVQELTNHGSQKELTDYSWQRKYREKLSEIKSEPSKTGMNSLVQLFDFDNDGIPELLTGSQAGTGRFSAAMELYTCNTLGVKSLSIDNNVMLCYGNEGYELYEKEGSYRVEGSYVLREGFEMYGIYYASYLLEENCLSAKNIYMEYHNRGDLSYYFQNENVKEKAYQKSVKKWYEGWYKIPDVRFAATYLTGENLDEKIDNLYKDYCGVVKG